ncbi:MFS transporter [Streptomyces sp. Je 1-4]|uniref:MFS transporter n=1 Tax=Streptomyces TaxID=1883 RepID=UPI0021DAB6EE|nr:MULTISPECIES: MFS transporter [unclassified Streptomyces]UYB38682.1 MFS transporter [Streptomyces sp. Je 1-4]UZQ34655.1 MFS transporter [Streptomyces sp. Je 1-4] [Streptomyces sp. Je 1-4 4N24]UZQ42073.1 MFS transporter [Streptomyces sp. Je 1-4] [Streptomyces sp. Je 1-4 4N24_ara]
MTVAAYRNLLLATTGCAVTFWAWSLLSPLGHTFRTGLSLTGTEVAALVAAPLLVGALGGVPVGALTDRFGFFGALMISDHPDRPRPRTSPGTRPLRAGRLRGTWEPAALYAIAFGGIVAAGVHLPVYLQTWYHLGVTEAGAMAAGCVLVAAVFRPLGGWGADRVHPAVVTAWSLGAAALCAIIQAFDPALNPVGTVDFLVMAAGLGAAAGAVVALVARVTPQERLGGFLPALVLGAVHRGKGTYSLGFLLLSDLAPAGGVHALARMRTAGAAPADGS